MKHKMRFIIFTIFSFLFFGCSKSYDGELIFVEPDNVDSFEFPYFLFIPNNVSPDKNIYIIIEPNNSGFADDDLKKHVEKAKRTATNDYYLGNYMAQELQYPLIVPVFPRSKSNWKIYTHALDRDVLLQKGHPLERLDKQLIEMFEDAQSRLEKKDFLIQDKFLLTGFSASGTFANRFTLIHPDRVLAVAAGGLNGLLMLPLDSLNNEELNYPIGTSDLEKITDKHFEKELFLNTPQFYFMGQLDENDAVPYDDAFDQNERDQIFRLLGNQMQPDRWNKCKHIYKSLHVNATIKTYEEVGHKHPESIKDEIAGFFREAIEEN